MAARKELCQQINGKKGNTARNLYLKGNGNTDGFLAFAQPTALADLTSDVCAFAFQSTTPKYWNGTTWASFTGGTGVNSWDDLYASDKNLTINGTTLTFNLTHATGDGLTLTSGVVTGDLLQITNSGTGKDVNGTSGTWSFSKTGALVCVGITNTGDVTTTGGAIDWDLIDNNASALSFDTAGKAGILEIVTTDAGEGVKMSGTLAVTGATTITGVLTASTGLVSSDGTSTFTDNSNVANGLVFVNNTVTTYGNATDAGPVHFSSTSLTTGALVTLSLSNTTLAGGYYLRGWEQDGGVAAFSIGENGATVLTGLASGTNVLTLTAGNLTVTSGDITVSEGSVFIVNTANESAFTIVADSVTTGIVVDINADGVTSGTLLHLDTTADAFVGLYINCYDGAASDFSVGLYGTTIIAGNAATTVFGITAGNAVFTAGDLTLSEGSIVLVNTADEAGLTVTTANVAGVGVSFVADSVTTGDVLKLTSSAAGMTTGNFINCNNGAATVFEVGLYGATTIAGNATGTAALTLTAGDILLTSGDVTLTDGDLILTVNDSKITFTGTGANGGVVTNLKNAAPSGLSGAQKDIEISIAGTPYYFTVYPTKA